MTSKTAPTDRSAKVVRGPVIIFYSRIDAFGDALIRLPALRAARTAFPDHHIVYGSQKRSMLQIALSPHVADLVDEWRTETPLADIVRDARQHTKSIAVIDLRTLVPAMAQARLSLIGSGVAYRANLPGFFLSSDFGRPFAVRPEHNAWRFHRLVERMAGRLLPFDHRLYPSDEARSLVRRTFADGRPLVLLSGNADPGKAMTDAQASSVAGPLIDEGFRVVYLLTPGPGPTQEGLLALEPRIEVVGADAAQDRHARDDHLLALGEIAEAAITIHSGMVHFLSATMTPMVVINNGFNMLRWRPLAGAAEIIEASDHSRDSRAAEVPPDAIAAALRRLVAARRRDHPPI